MQQTLAQWCKRKKEKQAYLLTKLVIKSLSKLCSFTKIKVLARLQAFVEAPMQEPGSLVTICLFQALYTEFLAYFVAIYHADIIAIWSIITSLSSLPLCVYSTLLYTLFHWWQLSITLHLIRYTGESISFIWL